MQAPQRHWAQLSTCRPGASRQELEMLSLFMPNAHVVPRYLETENSVCSDAGPDISSKPGMVNLTRCMQAQSTNISQ